MGVVILASASAEATTYLVRSSYASEASGPAGGKSTTSGHTTHLERVTAAGDGMVEIEVDFAPDMSAEDRQREWLYPIRAKQAADGSLVLLNSAEMTARVDAWLARAKLTRDACGSWYFTWNAFQVRCDVDDALQMLRDHGLGFRQIIAGQTVPVPLGLGTAILRPADSGRDGTTFTATLPVDLAAVIAGEREAEAVVAQIMGPRADGLPEKDYSRWRVSGDITVTLQTDRLGFPVQRVVVQDCTVMMGDGTMEKRTRRETLTRDILAE